MKATINKAELKKLMAGSEYFESVYEILAVEVKKYGATGGMQYGHKYLTEKGHTLYCEAYTDKELVYNSQGKMKQVNHTVHSLRIYRTNDYRQDTTLFEKYSTDSNGSIRNDHKTEKDVA